MSQKTPHILIIEARFYDELADELVRGAVAELDKRGAGYDRVRVPGVLEIPAAVAMALDSDSEYDGFIALGVVIRGETSHYDVVAGESARALMDLSIIHALALGNGIQTVENADQAWARAKVEQKNKGGGAASACLDMIDLRARMAAE